MKNVTLRGRGQRICFPLRSSVLCQATGFPWIDVQLTQTRGAKSKLRKDFSTVGSAKLSTGFVGKPGLGALPTWAWSQCREYPIPIEDEMMYPGAMASHSLLLSLVGTMWENTGMLPKTRAFFLCPMSSGNRTSKMNIASIHRHAFMEPPDDPYKFRLRKLCPRCEPVSDHYAVWARPTSSHTKNIHTQELTTGFFLSDWTFP